MMRNFDKQYLKIAKIWAQNSFATKKKVGSILVKNNRILSDGYNGTPEGFNNICETFTSCGNSCTNLFDNDCQTCSNHKLLTKPEVLHAEANAILKLAKHGGIGSEGATLYTTLSPCLECAKLIIQAGISKVVYDEQYRDISGLELLKEANIKIKQIKLTK